MLLQVLQYVHSTDSYNTNPICKVLAVVHHTRLHADLPLILLPYDIVPVAFLLAFLATLDYQPIELVEL